MIVSNANHYFLQGGGEMGELIRAKDWSQTSLGDPAEWPQSLRTMVAVMLDNPFGMYIAWGNDYTQLYNDGYRPILGASKHPQALGISTQETFAEIWHIIESMFEGVMKGKAVGFPDFMLPLNRNGFVEECYFDFSYSPIRKDDGEVGGVLVTVIETTSKKISEKALKESEERFRDTVHQAPVGITILRGKEFVVEMANDAYMQLVDRKHSEFIGRPLFDSLPEVRESVGALLEGVLNTGIPFQGNEVPVPLNRHGKQEVFYFDFLYHPLKEKDGQISGIVVTVTEVSEKVSSAKKIKENEKRLESIFFNAPAAIAVITGTDHTYVLANDAYQTMVGRTSEQLVGKTSKAVFPELVGSGTFEIFDAIHQSGNPFSLAEYPVQLDKNNDGNTQEMFFRFSAVPLKDTQENFDSILIVAVDITEQVVARKKVEESEKRFQLLVGDATAAIVVLTGADMKVEIANEAYAKLIGLKPHDLLGKPLFSVVPEAKDYYLPLLENVLQTGKMIQLYDSPYAVTMNGQRIEGFLHIVYQPYRDADGNIIGVMAIFQDVTESVLARKKIEQSERKFEAAIHAVAGIIWTNNASGEMVGEQPGWAKLTGQTFEEYQGYGWSRAVHDDDVQPTVDAWNVAVANRSTFNIEHRVQTKEDGYKIFSVKAVPIFDENGIVQEWVGVHTDISQQRETEQKIKESEERFKSLADESPMFVFIIDPDPAAPVSYNNKTWLTYTGLNAEEAAGRAWNGIMHPEDIPVALGCYVPALTERKPYLIPAARVLRFDGEYRWHTFQGSPRYLPNGDFNGYVGIGFDIHDQKLAEEKLKESEKRFRLLADSMPQHIWTSDPGGNLNYYNQSVFDYSGLTLEQIETGGWIQIVHPDDREANVNAWVHAITQGKNFIFEHRFRRHDGEYRWQLSRAIPQRDEHGKIQLWVGTSTDIQEQKNFVNELEKQVHKRTKELADTNIELEKMNKELQSFAYISSHDLQEPLRKIQTFSTQIMEKDAHHLSDWGKDKFLRMQVAARRMQTLIDDLLTYTRTSTQEGNFEETDLNTIVEEVKDELKEELVEKQATIQASELCVVNIIPFQFKQLMHNLIGNALKFSNPAQPPYITIKSDIVNGQDLIHANLSPERSYCHISVSDNGIGFEEQYREKIFEVFQRLHGQNEYKGTGIGLSIVKKIIENHKGFVTATSKINAGSTFNIFIPVD